MSDRFQPGANWTSKDGKRNVVIVSDDLGYRGPAFIIRNLSTGRETRIEVGGLTRKFRFTGYDPAYGHRGLKQNMEEVPGRYIGPSQRLIDAFFRGEVTEGGLAEAGWFSVGEFIDDGLTLRPADAMWTASTFPDESP